MCLYVQCNGYTISLVECKIQTMLIFELICKLESAELVCVVCDKHKKYTGACGQDPGEAATTEPTH
jgi:hypothetical protein